MRILARGIAQPWESYAVGDEQPDASPSLTLCDSDGVEIASGVTLTIDPVTTTLSATAIPGESVVRVASATGITVGRKYLIGGAGEQRELRKVRDVLGTDIHLYGALFYRHVSGAALVGMRMAGSLAGAQLQTETRFGKAEITWLYGTATRPPFVEQFAIATHYLRSDLDEHALSTHDEQLLGKLGRDFDLRGKIDEARQELDADITTTYLPWLLRGMPDAYVIAHKWCTFRLLYESIGDSERADRYAKLYQRALERVQALPTVDNDDDNAIDERESGGARPRMMWRS